MVSCSKTKISKAIDNSVAIVWLETVKKEQREEIGSFIEGQDVFQRAIKVLLLRSATTGFETCQLDRCL